MSRGVYGLNDHEKGFATVWGEDRIASYARDRAVDAAISPLKPFAPALDHAVRIHRGARWMRAGALLGGRDEAVKPFAQIGGEFFHSIKDRQLAIVRLSSDFRSLVNDLSMWHAANSGAPNASSITQWIAADVTPALDEWREFLKHENKSWWTKAATKWAAFENWQDRIRRLRGLARAHGVTLESQEPEDLPSTIWERGEEGKGGEGAALLGVLKVATAATLGIMGFVTLYAVVRELRLPKNVVEIEP
jgi:hypothetical protein